VHVVAAELGDIAGRSPSDARPRQPDPREADIVRLRKDKERLKQEPAKARFAMDVQAKPQALGKSSRQRMTATSRRNRMCQNRAISERPLVERAQVSGTPIQHRYARIATN
jgi:hypothetical protein